MTIFISENYVFWWDSLNLFSTQYENNYMFVTNHWWLEPEHVQMYKTGIFNKSKMWIARERIHGFGRNLLRFYLFEKYFGLKNKGYTLWEIWLPIKGVGVFYDVFDLVNRIANPYGSYHLQRDQLLYSHSWFFETMHYKNWRIWSRGEHNFFVDFDTRISHFVLWPRFYFLVLGIDRFWTTLYYLTLFSENRQALFSTYIHDFYGWLKLVSYIWQKDYVAFFVKSLFYMNFVTIMIINPILFLLKWVWIYPLLYLLHNTNRHLLHLFGVGFYEYVRFYSSIRIQLMCLKHFLHDPNLYIFISSKLDYIRGPFRAYKPYSVRAQGVDDGFEFSYFLGFLFHDIQRTYNRVDWLIELSEYFNKEFFDDLRTTNVTRRMVTSLFHLTIVMLFIYGPITFVRKLSKFLNRYAFKSQFFNFLYNKEYNVSLYGVLIFDAWYDSYTVNNLIDKLGHRQFNNVVDWFGIYTGDRLLFYLFPHVMPLIAEYRVSKKKNPLIIWREYKKYLRGYVNAADLAANYKKRIFYWSYLTDYISRLFSVNVIFKYGGNIDVNIYEATLINFFKWIKFDAAIRHALDLNILVAKPFVRFFIFLFNCVSTISSFFLYYIYYWVIYVPYIIFFMFHIFNGILVSMSEYNRVLFFHYSYLNYVIIKNCLKRFYTMKIFIKLILFIWSYVKYVLIGFKKILNVISMLQNIKLLSLNTKYYLTCWYFFLWRYNIVWKLFCLVFNRLIYASIIFFIATSFIDFQTWINFYYYIIALYFHFHKWFVLVFGPDSNWSFLFHQWFGWKFDTTYFNSYELGHVLLAVRYHDWDWIKMIEKGYESTSDPGYWSWRITNNYSRLFAKYGYDLNWYLMQAELIIVKRQFGFARYNKIIYMLYSPTWLNVIVNNYKLLLFTYFYYLTEWLLNISFYMFLYYLEKYLNFYNLYMVVFLVYDCMCLIFSFIGYYWNCFLIYYETFYYDMYDFRRWFFEIAANKYHFILIKYKVSWLYLFMDLVYFFQFMAFKVYFFMLYHFHYVMNYLLVCIVKVVNFFFGYWFYFEFDWSVVQFVRFFSTYIAAPFIFFFKNIFNIFGNQYNPIIGYQLTEPVSTLFPFWEPSSGVYGNMLDRFFLKSFLLKEYVVENYAFQTRFTRTSYKNLFPFVLFYNYIKIVMFLLFFSFTSKVYRIMFKNKDLLMQSMLNTWFRLRPSNYHQFTDMEMKWMQSLSWIHNFRKYDRDLFRADPFMKEDPYAVGVYLFNQLLGVYNTKKKFIRRTHGYRLVNALDSYLVKRYKRLLNIINKIFNEGITNLKKQNKMIYELEFEFDPKFMRNDSNDKFLDYYSLSNHNSWLLSFVMPYMYTFVDDSFFIENFIGKRNRALLRFMRKAQTLFEEKEKWKIDFIEFFFCEHEFYESLLGDFCPPKKKQHEFLYKLSSTMARNSVVYTPVYAVNSFSKKGFYEKCFRVEDKLLSLSKMDTKYFNNLINFTFFNQMEWPKIQRTRITLDHLLDLFNAWDRSQMLEEVPFLPASKAFTGEEVNPKYVELYVQNYFSTVIKKSVDVGEYGLLYNDVGLYVQHRKPIDSIGFLFYLPWIILGSILVDSFYGHWHPMMIPTHVVSFMLLFIKEINIEIFYNIVNFNPWFSVSLETSPVFIIQAFSTEYRGGPPLYWSLYTINVPYNLNVCLNLYSSNPRYLEPFSHIFNGMDWWYFMKKQLSELGPKIEYYTFKKVGLAKLKKYLFNYIPYYYLYYVGFIYAAFFKWVIPTMFIFPFIFTVTFALNYVINMLIMNDDYDFIFQKQNARLKKYNDLFGKK